MRVRPFDIRVPESTLRDLQERLAATRLPPDVGSDVRDLVDYWRTGFDWRAQEAKLLQLSHYASAIGGARVHFIHERGRGPAPLPLVLTHGFPDSYYRFHALIPLLTEPDDPLDAFDVVVPSLPGFAHSAPMDHGTLFDIAECWHELMTGLGYTRYGAHGGDWGSTITEHLGRSHRNAVVGIHLTDVPFWHAFRKPRRRSAAEDTYLATIDDFQQREGAYAAIQGTRPQTLADGLTDSPAGLVAWLLPFYQRWSERALDHDELLTAIMIYWSTKTIGSAFAPYHEVMHAGPGRWLIEAAKQMLGGKRVPAGFALFPKDLSHPPREWAERFFSVQRWSELPSGGHFAAMEEPALLAAEIRAFFRPLRRSLS